MTKIQTFCKQISRVLTPKPFIMATEINAFLSYNADSVQIKHFQPNHQKILYKIEPKTFTPINELKELFYAA
jgi:hypothetical protein